MQQSCDNQKPNIHHFILCLNPQCSSPQNRCMNHRSLHQHPSLCSHHFYSAQSIIDSPWQTLQGYPNDPVGKATKSKQMHNQPYLKGVINRMRDTLNEALKEFENKIRVLYPYEEIKMGYEGVYGLDRVAQVLARGTSPQNVTHIINQNFNPVKCSSLFHLNEKYDAITTKLTELTTLVQLQLRKLVTTHTQYQKITQPSQTPSISPICYGLYRSKFIGSSKIDYTCSKIHFPKLKHISSFLPWVYSQVPFSSGTHQIKLTSLKYPLIQNCGFTVLEQKDIDTYPYDMFKSLFNGEGKGFNKIHGEDIQNVAGSAVVVTLRLEFKAKGEGDGTGSRAIISDSERKTVYQGKLMEGGTFRMGIYGAGWAVKIQELT